MKKGMNMLRHIGIVVKDLNKSLYFYRDVLGLRVRREMREEGDFIDNLTALKKAKIRTVKLSDGKGSVIELLYYGSHKRTPLNKDICDTGYSHMAFTVKDLGREYKRLSGKGVKFNYAPQISPDGKAKVAFCRDPEGNLIELVEELSKKCGGGSK